MSSVPNAAPAIAASPWLPARAEGEYRCLLCDHVIEVFDGSFEIALRLTIQPEKTFR